MFQEYGANPSPMSFSELFSALQTGVMDGQENPLTQIYSAKLQEVQKYLSLSAHVYTPAYLTVGTKRYAKLPENVRKIIEDTARENQRSEARRVGKGCVSTFTCRWPTET